MFRRVVLVVLLGPVVLGLGSLFLPSRYKVERSQLMNGSPESVYALLNTLKRWPEWAAWPVDHHPDTEIAYAGPEAGVGASLTWQSKSSGTGGLKITGSEPAHGIRYEVEFEHGKYLCTGAIALRLVGEMLEVTWTNQGKLGPNPVSRYFGLFLDNMMGPDMETGLHHLQKKVEPRIKAN